MRISLALLFLVAFSGCSQTGAVRYVYQDRDFGVIGMPENTDCWPTFYRTQGEKLMADHFKEGHEIVRAEEVIEGERTLKVEGSIPPRSRRRSASRCSRSSSSGTRRATARLRPSRSRSAVSFTGGRARLNRRTMPGQRR